MTDFFKILERELKNHLPGVQAQLMMGSDIRMKELKWLPENGLTKQSGVMILLYPYQQSIYSVLIQRPPYDGTHGGQVCLPGGKREHSDTDLIHTALRETQEEIGVDSGKIKILGPLTKLYIPPSNYMIHPVVGYINEKPVFKKDDQEVDEIITYDISLLLNPDLRKITIINYNHVHSFEAPYFDIQHKIVWGATAMVLSEFKEILKKNPPDQFKA